MKYGKVKIQNGNVVFFKHMMTISIPCYDIVWAYMKRDGNLLDNNRHITNNLLVIITKRKKEYEIDLSEKEINDFLYQLKVINPKASIGFKAGGKINLQSTYNTRDLGGIESNDGSHIIPHRLYRSDDLYHLSTNDVERFENELNLDCIVDLRTSKERLKRPDTFISNINYETLKPLDEDFYYKNSIFKMAKDYDGNIDEYMINKYRSIIDDPFFVKQAANFIDLIVNNDNGKAILWHGGRGHHRTGIMTAITLLCLDIPWELIRDDYMKSNIYLHRQLDLINPILSYKKYYSKEYYEKLRNLLTVKEIYIDQIYESIHENYISVSHFLRKSLYLNQKNLEDLRENYLV